jgi:hypothetical protein
MKKGSKPIFHLTLTKTNGDKKGLEHVSEEKEFGSVLEEKEFGSVLEDKEFGSVLENNEFAIDLEEVLPLQGEGKVASSPGELFHFNLLIKPNLSKTNLFQCFT